MFSNKANGLLHFQELLLPELLKKRISRLGNSIDDIVWWKEVFCSRRVLIVLDDVDKLIQVNSLVGQYNWFGSRSRIVIMTRDEHLLQVNAHDIYNTQELNYNDSLELFSWHAFKTSIPLQEYVELSHNLVTSVGGNH